MARESSKAGRRREHEATEEATGERAGTGRRALTPTLRLLFTSAEGIARGAPVTLLPGRTVVGRSPRVEQAIALPEETRCSRVHAYFDRTGDSLRVIDAGSKNGTFVNGVRTEASPLSDGDLVRLGDALLLVRDEPGTPDDGAVMEILGDAPVTRALRQNIRLLAPSDAAILLLGESGVGKEVAARALHRLSRRSGAFVGVNASAIPESLAESQLFGHEAGAFTGAGAAQPGFFRAAQGGTLFLDELGELPPRVQPKLLRALEAREVWPLGASAAVPVDVRMVSATNLDLRAAMQNGAFRGDLYARLSEMTIELPPLRARSEDILPILAGHLGSDCARLSAELAEALVLYAWPLNVRELITVAKELRVRGAEVEKLGLDLIKHRLLPSSAQRESEPPPASPEVKLSIPSRTELERALEEHRGRVADVAKATGRSRAQVYRWIEQHGLDLESFRGR